ncbi:translocation protein SEC62 [Leptonychotes weddellii]|uniref:Translocation protein SEC62 n=1 Tax=Leptonychotes weddellii TaxID=9713 RepID=A0A7F8R1R8_LEPWE|nr:translocation protein SEC62 [Leptonychotes weddellii]
MIILNILILQEVGEPSKEEKAVAKYLRFNCPTKSTNMMGHRVDYFIASKAVDCLLDSKWAKAKKGEEALFTTRESVVDYCNSNLRVIYVTLSFLVLVIAVIAATLFPLWPAEMRVGVYYLSVGAGCFVASILLLAVARCILFLIIWLITGGRHHFWFLPNLTADVGFIDSFRPLYTHEYKGPKADFKKDEKSETKKQQKSDSEEKSDSEKKEDEEGKVEPGNHGTEGSGGERHSDTDSDRREDDRSQHSSGNGNDFEMITKEELEQQTDGDCEEEEEDNDGETTKSSHEKS